ncbi:unnamed protein product [Mycena citricolor]|uniref:Autophagy-related protein n=1 Tax=Mycena citricolor TaxID=2018698 RepID=A0AAD2GWH3_9AGAR|nr:unnamed protein product [Mycena citricolor]
MARLNSREPSSSHPSGTTTTPHIPRSEHETTPLLTPMPMRESDSPREPVVSRKELWSYYLYWNGDCGLGPALSMTLFQSLAFAAGHDPAKGPGSSCSGSTSGQCVLPWAGGGSKPVSSVVLIANGLSFTAMTVIFTTLSSAADYGNLGRWLLLISTLVCWTAQFATLSLTSPSRWGSAMALYMASFVSYGATLVFANAVFPRLARNTRRSRGLQEQLARGEITREECEVETSLEKNRISNISIGHANIGYTVTQCLNLGILIALAGNRLVNNYTIVLTNTYWVVLGMWWFICQQSRPGPPLPPKQSYLTIGWQQVWVTCKEYQQLPNTFIYLFAVFLLSDGLNTTWAMIAICQNNQFSFSFLQNTYLGLAQSVTSVISTFGFWYIQRHWKIATKRMFLVTVVVTVMIPLWGMVGIWTHSFGFRRPWEFWMYNIVAGLLQAPYYAFSTTMMAELTPPGYDNMFFGLFGLSNRVSSLIGPNVVQAIINASGDDWMAFPFLFSLCLVALLIIWVAVDMRKGQRDAVAWAGGMRRSS